jgi:hypothetical protein
MLLSFSGFFRVYFQDFVPDVLWLLQKPVSMLNIYRTIILGGLVTIFQKYLVNLQVQNIGIGYSYTDRKTYSLDITYKYNKGITQETMKSVQTINI